MYAIHNISTIAPKTNQEKIYHKMASILWTGVFVFLTMELVVTLILVLPVWIPRKIRNTGLARKVAAVSQWNLKKRLRLPVLFIATTLSLALLESYLVHQRILQKMDPAVASHADGHYLHSYASISSGVEHLIQNHHFKERKYKAERNMYLTGFALTLLFVINRIIQLMQESVEQEKERERILLKYNPAVVNDSVNGADCSKVQCVEMETIPKDPDQKKKD